jgi:hypothetical protein
VLKNYHANLGINKVAEYFHSIEPVFKSSVTTIFNAADHQNHTDIDKTNPKQSLEDMD